MEKKFKIIKGMPSQKYNSPKFMWDDYVVGMEDEIIGDSGFGPCLGITLYSQETKKGVLAHIEGSGGINKNYLPEKIIDFLLNLNFFKDINPQSLEASLAGEYLSFASPKKSNVVKRILKYYHIPVIGEDLGGGGGRIILLNCLNGCVNVYRH